MFTFHMKQHQKQGRKNQIGAYGEEIAAAYLTRLGYTILETNYLKKWGEIDIISRETSKYSDILHFVEVKTISHETKADLERAVSYGTWRPEENVHPQKLNRLARTIESWLLEHNISDRSDWQIDICAVRIVTRERYATVKFIPNIIL